MNPKLDLNDKNKITVMLVQALWGVISPNFRMVALELAKPTWQLLFVLESESAADREEIEDAIGEFDALLLGLHAGTAKYTVNVVVNAELLPALDPSLWQIVFRRRERVVLPA